MKMRATQGVSFPRSGHSAVFHIAKRYFGDAFVYCDFNNRDLCGCRSTPCVNPARTFAKCHDFDLRKSPGVPILADERYFIQYRNPVRSIVSNFHLYLQKHPDEDSKSGWESFAFRDVFFWNRFVDKWVLDFPPHARQPLYCTYEALIANPQIRMKEILSYLSDGPLDEAVAGQVLDKMPIAPRNKLAEFRYFDHSFFEELEDAASERLAELDLPSYTEEL